VLILGLSDIVKRRALPALRALGDLERVDVATRKASDRNLRDSWDSGDIYDDYALALDRSKAQLVYISLVNSEHQRWAQEAIERGFHVVVDKPACLSLGDAERMLDLAEQRRVCLAEATVFAYHPQVDVVRDIFRDSGGPPRRMTVEFSFPPFEPGNFRYQRALGGGALSDLGPYAAAVGRVFFGEAPSAVACSVVARDAPGGLETAFSALAVYPDGRSLIGHFGFDTVYRNRLGLVSADVAVEVNRAFTTPPDLANEIKVTRREGATTICVPAGDSFGLFFGHVFRCLAARDWSDLASDLHRDAQTLDRLRTAAHRAGMRDEG
jgi:predicted dehydrogenase